VTQVPTATSIVGSPTSAFSAADGSPEGRRGSTSRRSRASSEPDEVANSNCKHEGPVNCNHGKDIEIDPHLWRRDALLGLCHGQQADRLQDMPRKELL
jgi:hypothetical protein